MESSVINIFGKIGSHYHIIESNPELKFNRLKSYGYILDIPAGEAVRFEPRISKTVGLVKIGGNGVIRGGNNIAPSKVDILRADEITQRLKEGEFEDSDSDRGDDEDSHGPRELTRHCKLT